MKQKRQAILFVECQACGLHFRQPVSSTLVCPRCGWQTKVDSEDAALIEDFLHRAKQWDEEAENDDV